MTFKELGKKLAIELREAKSLPIEVRDERLKRIYTEFANDPNTSLEDLRKVTALIPKVN